MRQALTDTAELLDSLVDQTLALMNAGARLDEVLHTVTVPAHLAERPYLRPVYDEPEFVVRNVWRQYGGWWDGNPSSLKPAPEAALAGELAALAGGAGALADRALALALAGSASGTGGPDGALRLAGHLAELAALAAPADEGVHRARAEVFARLAEAATSTMAKGVFSWTSRESEAARPSTPTDGPRPTTTGRAPFASVVAVSPGDARTRSTDAPRRRRRLLAAVGAMALPVVLGGCQLPTFFGYKGSTKQGHDEFVLYSATTIASIVVFVLVAALIVWAVVRYRRRSDEMPRQFQYHIPLEITYTIVPVIIVLILFGFTVVVENRVDAVAANPAVKVKVTAFQWGWQFNYPGIVQVTGETTEDPDPVGMNGAVCAPAVDCLGPGLVVPAGQTTRITLVSRDVIHGFYVPQFNFSRYAQPGITNTFDLTVQKTGIYRAQCTQLCGLYHSLMFFHVVALPPAQFQAWLSSERSATTTAAATHSPSSSTTKAAA